MVGSDFQGDFLELSLIFSAVCFRKDFPQCFAAIDNLRVSAFMALIFAHVAARERGLFDLVHLNPAVGTDGIGIGHR